MRAYVIRDENGRVFVFKSKPEKFYFCGCWAGKLRLYEILDSDLPEGINPKWSDKEPIEVELKLEKA